MSLNNTYTPSTKPARAAAAAAVAACLTLLALAVPFGPARTAPVQTIVTLNLTRFPKVARIEAGQVAGVSPARVVVRVGDEIVFVNGDNRNHTATSLPDATEFPQNPQWTDGALRASGKIGEANWSTGELAPGARSAPIVATKAGTYLYGCFFDYSAGMRGEIVVQP
jgi:plastocyanin